MKLKTMLLYVMEDVDGATMSVDVDAKVIQGDTAIEVKKMALPKELFDQIEELAIKQAKERLNIYENHA